MSRASLLLTLLFFAGTKVSAEDDCFLPELQETKNICETTLKSSQIQTIRELKSGTLRKLGTDSNFQNKLEGEFFWDFLKDQFDQTSCELDMLKSFDLGSNERVCPEDRGKKMNRDRCDRNLWARKIAIRYQLTIQKAILEKAWETLPEIARLETLCKKASSKAKSLWNDSRSSSLGSKGELLKEGLKQTEIDENQKEAAKVCGELSVAYGKVWSGSTPEMRAFLKPWIDRFKVSALKRTDVERERFLKEALPDDVDAYQKCSNQETSLGSFQKKVVDPLICESQSRRRILQNHMKGDGSEPLAGTFVASRPDVGSELKTIMMKDGGKAALAFMKRSDKYRSFSKELQCRLGNKYYALPNHYQNVKRIGFGGLTILVTAGAATGVEGMAILGIVVDSGIAINAINEARKTCDGSSDSLGSLQTQPICEQFKGPLHIIAGSLPSQLEKQDCDAAIIEGVLASAGAGFSFLSLRNAARPSAMARPAPAAEVIQASEPALKGKKIIDRTESLWRDGDQVIPRVGSENIRVSRVRDEWEILPDNYDSTFFQELGAKEPSFAQLRLGRYEGFSDKNGEFWKFHSFDKGTGEVYFLSPKGDLVAWRQQNVSVKKIEMKISVGATEDHTIEVHLPGYALAEHYSHDSPIVESLASLPKNKIKNVDVMKVHMSPSADDAEWRKIYKDPDHVSAATAEVVNGRKTINIFPSVSESPAHKFIEEYIPHEFGHLLASEKYGSMTPDSKWTKAIATDWGVVSENAARNLEEDFAETVMQYLKDNGKRRDGLEARYALLDKEFLKNPNLKPKMQELAGNVVFIDQGKRKAIGIAAGVAIGGASATVIGTKAIAVFKGKELNLFVSQK